MVFYSFKQIKINPRFMCFDFRAETMLFKKDPRSLFQVELLRRRQHQEA